MTFSKIMGLIALTACGAAMACAGTITVTLDQPSQSGGPGDTLMFFGVISSTGAGTEFLNSDSLNLSATAGDFITNDGPFFANAPLSLASGASTADIELFDVSIVNPFPRRSLRTADYSRSSEAWTGVFGYSHRPRGRFQRVRG